MTNEEAKKVLMSVIGCDEMYAENCFDRDCPMCEYHYTDDDKIAAMKLAIEALDKHHPKQLWKIDYNNGGTDYFCPCCNKRITMRFEDPVGEWFKHETQHCEKCGQALDWSYEE